MLAEPESTAHARVCRYLHRHFEHTYGPAQKLVAEASLIPLPGSIPPDYEPPAGVSAPTGEGAAAGDTKCTTQKKWSAVLECRLAG